MNVKDFKNNLKKANRLLTSKGRLNARFNDVLLMLVNSGGYREKDKKIWISAGRWSHTCGRYKVEGDGPYNRMQTLCNYLNIAYAIEQDGGRGLETRYLTIETKQLRAIRKYVANNNIESLYI